jgi:hypothetical protein
LSNHVKEVWRPKPMSASGQLAERGGTCAGFLCATSTSGTVEIKATDASGATVIIATPVTAGSYTPMPSYFQDGAYAVLTNCTGTFFV